MSKLIDISAAGRTITNKSGRLVRGLLLGSALLLLSHAASATPLLNAFTYTFRAVMTNSGVDTNARGTVTGTIIRRGLVDLQRLTLTVAKLDTNTTYNLDALLDSNVAATNATNFTTGPLGGSTVFYVKNPRPGGTPLPAVADPISNLRELRVVNGGAATVLAADLTDPVTFFYAVTHAMENTGFIPGAGGVLRLSGNPYSTRASVAATGLVPLASYQLIVNGVGAMLKTADRRGNMLIIGPGTGMPLVLDIRTVELGDDTGTNTILTLSGLGIPGALSTATLAPVPLGAAARFAVLAGSTVTSINATALKGDLGLAPGSAVTGFPPGTVVGTLHIGDLAAYAAKAALTIAYNDAKGRTLAPVSVAGNLGGRTLAPGLYKSTGSLEISSGDLVLDAQGDANAVFIFQIASTLTTTSGRQVTLIGGAKAGNITWQVGTSATLGTTSVFKGTIMADQSITLNTGATLDGRALARIGAVTMDSDAVTVPVP